MGHNLMRQRTIVLKNVVVFHTRSFGNSLAVLKDLEQVLIRNVGKLRSVILGNYQSMSLGERSDVEESVGLVRVYQLEAWDLASGKPSNRVSAARKGLRLNEAYLMILQLFTVTVVSACI